MLEPGSTATNPQVNDALGALATANARISTASAMLEPGSTATNPQVNDALGALATATNAVVGALPLDCEFAACVALTFDDGPTKQVTPQLLGALQQADAPATFFVQGQFVSGSNRQLLATMAAQGNDIGSLSWPTFFVQGQFVSGSNRQLLVTMAAQGNDIGSLSWRHKQLHTLSPSELGKWFADTDEVIVNAGVGKPTLFRPPDGAWSEAVVEAARGNGQSVILWNVDSRDWDPKTSAADIARNVLDGASSGAIHRRGHRERRRGQADPVPAAGRRMERGRGRSSTRQRAIGDSVECGFTRLGPQDERRGHRAQCARRRVFRRDRRAARRQ